MPVEQKLSRGYVQKHTDICYQNASRMQFFALREKYPNTELFLARIFLYSNTGKYGTELHI